MKLSIVIPCFNGALRLPQVLDSLKMQQGIAGLEWEIIVVDNNSRDDTRTTIEGIQSSWNAPMSLRYEFEPRQGAAYARWRGMDSARGELVAFLDDDNLVNQDWIKEAVRFADAHRETAAFGGCIEPRYEHAPPEGIQAVEPLLAVCRTGFDHAYTNMMPPSAGLVVRAEIWRRFVPREPFFGGRTGDSLIAGEDVEALLCMHHAGGSIWHNPRMQLTHLIPSSRLQPDYLNKLSYSTGLARYPIRKIRLRIYPAICRPFILSLLFSRDLWRYLSARIAEALRGSSNCGETAWLQYLRGTLAGYFRRWN